MRSKTSAPGALGRVWLCSDAEGRMKEAKIDSDPRRASLGENGVCSAWNMLERVSPI